MRYTCLFFIPAICLSYCIPALAESPASVRKAAQDTSLGSQPKAQPEFQIINKLPPPETKEWWHEAIVPIISALITGALAIYGISMGAKAAEKNEYAKQLFGERLKLYVQLAAILKEGSNITDEGINRTALVQRGIISADFVGQVDYPDAYVTHRALADWINKLKTLDTLDVLASKDIQSRLKAVNALQMKQIKEASSLGGNLDDMTKKIGIRDKQMVADTVESLISFIQVTISKRSG
jgi:hypothetical protein